MKKTTNYQRATQYLVKIFKHVNEEYFHNELEAPAITIQSTLNAYGHVTTFKAWHTSDTASYELNVSADYLTRPIENVVATIIHESCHLYALQAGIKDTSNKGVYHNKRFKALAESRGLIISRHEKYGWSITEPSEETIDFCIKYDLSDIEIGRQTPYSFSGLPSLSGTKAADGDTIPKVRKPSSTRKYICPCCGNSFRATKNINVLCMDCGTQFIIAP